MRCESVGVVSVIAKTKKKKVEKYNFVNPICYLKIILFYPNNRNKTILDVNKYNYLLERVKATFKYETYKCDIYFFCDKRNFTNKNETLK